jgi:nickel/cobalt exporter
VAANCGLWLSLVERCVRDAEAVGSNPTSPTVHVGDNGASGRSTLRGVMNQTEFSAIALTGFTVAFFHVAMPTHWLPFVLTARAQRWPRAKALAITGLAASGHVVFTALLGLLVTVFGFALHERTAAWFPRIGGSLLILFGLLYLYRQLTGDAHGHGRAIGEDPRVHAAHQASHDESDLGATLLERRGVAPVPDHVAITSLLALLTFSPCEAFVPFYISGLHYGWFGFWLLTAILSVATLTGMVALTWLTLSGIKHIALRQLERYELGLMGILLCAVGVLIIFFNR